MRKDRFLERVPKGLTRRVEHYGDREQSADSKRKWLKNEESRSGSTFTAAAAAALEVQHTSIYFFLAENDASKIIEF